MGRVPLDVTTISGNVHELHERQRAACEVELAKLDRPIMRLNHATNSCQRRRAEPKRREHDFTRLRLGESKEGASPTCRPL